MTDSLIARISTALSSEETLEGFVRQLLEMLELVTGMESTYLTRIDSQFIRQQILYARNSGTMTIPEGLSVPWEDTLCKRALDEGRLYCDTVPTTWKDSDAAKALGITTYSTTPVKMPDGTLYGTLCAASTQSQPLSDRAQQIMQLFAELISQYLRQEALLEQLQQANTALTATSFTDELTGLPNRRAVFDQLPRLFARARQDACYVLVAFADLDGFKLINDQYGHETGDAFLRAVAQRLMQDGRIGEVQGRLGGDEFVVATLGPALADPTAGAAQTLKQRLATLLKGKYDLDGCLIEYAGASFGVIAVNPVESNPDEAVRQADEAMYQDKKQRKSEAAARQRDMSFH